MDIDKHRAEEFEMQAQVFARTQAYLAEQDNLLRRVTITRHNEEERDVQVKITPVDNPERDVQVKITRPCSACGYPTTEPPFGCTTPEYHK